MMLPVVLLAMFSFAFCSFPLYPEGCAFEKMFDENMCDEDMLCVKPRDASPVPCEPNSILQVKTDGQWEEVKSALCLWNEELSFTRADGSSLTSKPDSVRCARLKCATCSNPCPTCVYKQSSKWNECTKFNCGGHSRLAIPHMYTIDEELTCAGQEDSSDDKWEWIGGSVSTDFIRDARCEHYCTPRIPLTSTCPQGDYLGKTIDVYDGHFSCNYRSASLVIHFTEHKGNETIDVAKGNTMYCDFSRGIWIIRSLDLDGTDADISREGNVVCEYRDCDISWLCQLCEREMDSPNTYRCPPDHRIGVRGYQTGTRLLDDSARIVCKLGKWEDDKGMPLDEHHTVTCLPMETTEENAPHNPAITANNTTKNYPSSVSQTWMSIISFVLIGILHL